MSNQLKIGIIGGTGLDQDSKILKNATMVPVPDTPYGPPSDPEIVYGLVADDVPVYILARHGRRHDKNPTDVNYRANLWTLKQLGVTHVLTTSACGSLRERMAPGHLGIVDQYIDRTTVRGGRSFYRVAHIPQGRPFDSRLQELLLASAREAGYPVHPALTAVCIEGPRFSTLAESRLYQSWNADIVNMTMVPEAPLASELGFVYATLALVTDYDCWHSPELSASVEFVGQTLETLSGKAKDVLARTIAKIKCEDWRQTLTERAEMARQAIMFE